MEWLTGFSPGGSTGAGDIPTPEGRNPEVGKGKTPSPGVNPATAASMLAMLLKPHAAPEAPPPPVAPAPSPLVRPAPLNAGDFLRQAMQVASLRDLAGGGPRG